MDRLTGERRGERGFGEGGGKGGRERNCGVLCSFFHKAIIRNISVKSLRKVYVDFFSYTTLPELHSDAFKFP